ncbi:hypothetical protein HY480_00880 [Candidatus Uhrbacteria bacterium]|nr:hypothetical protein [Candidatus Uhrbacteria bacterium]
MFLTLHASAGALVGELAPSPWLALLFGFLSHFPMDMFPHGDRKMGDRAMAHGGHHVRKYVVLILADALVGLGILAAGFALGKFEHPWYAYLGMLGGLLPDLIVAIPEYAMFVKKSERVALRWFYRFHNFNHNKLITAFDLPMRVGLVGQGLLLLLIWKLW